MTEAADRQARTRFDRPGTLVRPGPLGRLVRLLIGLVCVNFAYEFAFLFDYTDLRAELLWVWIALSILIAPEIVNIGFGVSWEWWPRVPFLLLWAAAFGLALIIDGNWVSEWLWQPIRWSEIYLWGHLGISFVLAALIGTPGCEMRAIPDLIGRLRGKAAQEHYCPGHIDRVDAFERKLYARFR